MNLKEKFIVKIIRFNQFLTWPILFIIFHAFFKISIEGRENLDKLQSSFIIISNHIAFYDSFLFRLILGYFTPHLPLRFMAVTSFKWRFLNFLSKIGIIDFIYLIFGVFTVVLGQGIDKNLKEATEIINQGGNVVMYPEGGIIVGGKIAPFKRGSAVLVKRAGVKVIPITFHKKNYFLFRKEICINIGEVIHVSRAESVENITDMFYRKVGELYGG
ncbi:MAG: lysophospholipid acyltransferase family protein [Patescibacteria group bacterium]